jgi:hypothetical protein
MTTIIHICFVLLGAILSIYVALYLDLSFWTSTGVIFIIVTTFQFIGMIPDLVARVIELEKKVGRNK